MILSKLRKILGNKPRLPDIIALLIIFLGLGIWQLIAEKWEITGDAIHYLQITKGNIAPKPFCYRILVPLIVRFLPFDYILSYRIIALLSLVFVGYFIYNYTNLFNKKKQYHAVNYLGIYSFLLSYPAVYYSTAHVRVDPLALFILIILFYGAKKGWNFLFLALILMIGVATHEYVLIFIPFFLIASVSRCYLVNEKYSIINIFFITLLTLLIFFLIRMKICCIENPSKMTYYDVFKIVKIVKIVISYSGGLIMHLARIWAAFGVLWFLAISQLCFFERKETKYVFFLIVMIVGLLTLIAADTLRISSIAFPLVILFSYKFLLKLSYYKMNTLLIGILLLHALWGYIVYGHLRSFERDTFLQHMMVLVTILLSLLILVSIFYLKRICEFENLDD
jgi:hypothetical protein